MRRADKRKHRHARDVKTLGVAPVTTVWQVPTRHGGRDDLPSNLDDAQGTAQPKAPTFEVSHAFAVAAAATAWFKFYLDVPAALHDIVAVVSANAAGKVGESVTIYAQAA